MRLIHQLLVLVLAASICSKLAQANLYPNGKPIRIQVNNVRPYHNPAEAYDFYSLPFCEPRRTKQDHLRFGEALAGDRKKPSAYEILFRTRIGLQRLCSVTLSQNEIKRFIDAIKQDYMFEMFVDDLPVLGFIGDVEKQVQQFTDHPHEQTKYFLYTHLAFTLSYHSEKPHEAGHVIAVNITTSKSKRQELVYGEDLSFDFTYSAKWVYTPVTYENRLFLHQQALIGDLALEIHWLSIVNSFVLVVLLTTFLAVILMRILKNDFSRYMDADADELGSEIDDSGWKQVHGDVFRAPNHLMLLTSVLGTGVQLFALAIGLLFLAVSGLFQPGNEAPLYTAAVLIYALTSSVAGYVSADLYHKLGGTRWASAACLTASIFTGPLLLVFATLNSIALAYKSNSALPFNVIFLLVVLWALVTFPLAIFGALRAKKDNRQFEAPCKTNFVRREIPATPLLRKLPFQMFMAGFLPFSAIYVEIHYLFSAIWGPRVYTLFGILTLAFSMLVLVTAFITIALTYFQLAIEDYRWWWRSFLCGGSAGIFIYAYALFYFCFRSQMYGTLQGAFYFGYSFMLAYAFFLVLGSIGFFSSLWFVRRIYSSIKSD